MKLSLSVLLVVFCLHVSAESLFTHRLKRVPKGSLSCTALADDLAARFAAEANVELYSAGVTAQTNSDCDLEFGYLAEEAVPSVSTIDRHDFSSEPNQTAYPTLQKCEERLGWEKELLLAETGLNAWVAYCYPDSRLSSWQKFVPFAQALGKSDKRLYKASSDVWVTPEMDWQEFAERIINGISETKLVRLASLSYDPGIVGGRELSLRFYDTQRRWLRIEGFAPHGDTSVCKAQISRISEKLRAATEAPALVYCGKKFGREPQLGMVLLPSEIIYGSPIKDSLDPKQFASLEECMSNLDAVENFYREKLNRPVLGGFCAGAGPYQVTVFEVRKQPTPPTTLN